MFSWSCYCRRNAVDCDDKINIKWGQKTHISKKLLSFWSELIPFADSVLQGMSQIVCMEVAEITGFAKNKLREQSKSWRKLGKIAQEINADRARGWHKLSWEILNWEGFSFPFQTLASIKQIRCKVIWQVFLSTLVSK